jgi:citrate/tricarballylate utilization protein
MFVATVAAAIQQDVFGVDPPFGLLSIPVIFGTVGGISTVSGCVGFMVVARRTRRGKSTTSARLDRMFGVMLLATTASGLLVLVLRSTVALGPVLLLHLALVGGFFLCLPYSKFVHAAYRYIALVQFHIETKSPTIVVPDTLVATTPREPVLSDPSNLTGPA